MGREEARGGDSEGVRREKKTKEGEEVREFIVRNAEWVKENIFSYVTIIIVTSNRIIISLWEGKRPEGVIVRVWEERKKTKEGEEVREFIVRNAEWVKENIFS